MSHLLSALASGKRASALVAATAVTAIGLTGTALAAPTSIPKTSVGIRVNAAPGTHNHITIEYRVAETLESGFERDAQFITDTAGLTVQVAEGQLCNQPVGNTTACYDTGTSAGVPAGTTGTGEDPVVLLGNLSDTFLSDNVGNLGVLGGPGDDTLVSGSRPMIFGGFEGEPGGILQSEENFDGGTGDDLLKGFGQPDGLSGGPGNDVVDGGKGRDWLSGGSGNDFLDARDGQKDKGINCGAGKDRVKRDRIDPKPISC
jgi:Ca2+-binding RTX toxin-like protein